MSSLNWPGAVEDIKHACEYLKTLGCSKIGVVGYCMGGALSLASAINVDEIDCSVVFYGIPPKQLADPKNLSKPAQFHFGDKDKSPGFSDISAADGLRDTIKEGGNLTVVEYRHSETKFEDLKREGPVAEFHRYVDGDHAFSNETAPAYPYNVY